MTNQLETIGILETVTGGNQAQTIARGNLAQRWGTTSGVVTFDRSKQIMTIDNLWGGGAVQRGFSYSHGPDGRVHARSFPLR